jgi:hypothetical protein
MSDFNVRSDAVDVDEIMRQIRARIREKRGADYTEAEIAKLASVKLEKFLDPRGVRSDLVEQFRRSMAGAETPAEAVDETVIYGTRPILRKIRGLLNPILKLFLSPAALLEAAGASATARRRQDLLIYELVHNLVVEVTRLGIDVHNMKMRVESLSSRVDFDERRARSLEGVVQFRPPAPKPDQRPEPRSDQQRRDPRQNQRQNQRQDARPADRPVTPPDPAAAAAAVAAPGTPGPVSPAGPAGPVGPASPMGPVGPGTGNREGAADGDRRRRRRRRRRRPGQTMGDSGATGLAAPKPEAEAGPAAPKPQAEAGAPDSFPDEGSGSDGPDDGASDQ